MRSTRLRAALVATVACVSAWASSVSQAEQRAAPGVARSTADLQLAITRYCAGCHNERSTTSAIASGVLLDKVDLAQVAERGEMWEKVVRKLRAGVMPPAGVPRPDAETHDALVTFLEDTLDRHAAAHRVSRCKGSLHRETAPAAASGDFSLALFRRETTCRARPRGRC